MAEYKQNSLFKLIIHTLSMKLISKLVFISAILLVIHSQVTQPLDVVGTVLPQFVTSSVPYRAFNDLMKQSLPLVPYQLSSWGSIGRCWGCNLTFINNQSHNYPSSLPRFMWAVAQIKFLSGNDEYLANQVFNIKFAGKGVVGALQNRQFNLTWNQGSGGQFTLKLINQSLFIYIYNTDPTDPVRSISVVLDSLGATPSTYTAKFISYVRPFKILRTCFWQGQNLYNSGKTLQIWNNRTLVSSSTQISSNGVALEHILELQAAAGVTLWPCIPDTADNNYITQMSTLIGTSRDKNILMYLQYGNAYTTMNDFPDLKTNPAFTTFMQAYGQSFRNKVLFTINYKNVQYYINAMGMVNRAVNFTYIDAIGFDSNFGILDIGEVWNGTIDDIKSNLTNQMLAYEVVVNTAYQKAKRNKTNLITYSGGPYIKTYRYAYIWKNSSNSSYAANASIQLQLANKLKDLNLNDPWVGEFYLQWLARLKSMGMKTIVMSQLVGGAFTTDTDIVPLVPFLNMTTPGYKALSQFSTRRRATTLPTFGSVPVNPFICSPSCVWGDCINNVCACYAGYSGDSCNTTVNLPASQEKIGINLQGISYWTTQHPYIDMHKEGSDWVYFLINGGWSSGDAFKSQVKFDANGYPTYLPPGITVGTLIARDVKTHYDPGNYTILYDGDGVLNFGMFDVKRIIYGIGKCIVEVLPSTNMNNGILVIIERTNPKNYVRNIRVIRPGFENTWYTQKFSPMLLQKLSPYKTLRFMDWTNTNAQTDKNWTTRVYPAHRTFTKNGVPWQDVIHLANILGKDVWINIPHLATSDYISQLSKLFLNKLAPRLKVYVQYSNEVWGTLFPGGQYAQAQGVTYYKNNITDPTQARFCWLSLITKNISDIWRSVWNSTANRARLNIVVSTQSVNADTTRRILACENLYTKVNFVAIAPYISTTLSDNMTNNDVFNALNNQLITLNATMKTHLNIIRGYNLSFGCYEAGQGLTPSTSATNTLQVAVQTDQRMETLYTKYYEMLFNNSMALVNHYTDSSHFSKYGSWGIFQYTDQKPVSSAKWNGTKSYLIAQNLSIPTLTFGSCNLNCNNNGFCSFNRCICYSDYTGSNCSIGRYIDYYECGYLCTFNQGVCQLTNVVGITRYFGCTCNPGYTGVHCGIPICNGNCSFAGKCTAANTCTCFRGRMGSNCEIDCGCGGHGLCNNDGTCQCDTGFIYNSTSKKCEYSCFNQVSSNCYGPNLRICLGGCVGGTCNNGTCQCWPGFSGQNCSNEANPNYVNNNLGINIGGLAYWSTQHFLKDYFKQSSQWIPQYYPGFFNSSIAYTWDTNQSFPSVQANGYPGSLNSNQSAAKLLLRDLNLRYPSISETDEYVLLYDGAGIIELGFDARAYQYSNGRIRFRVVPSVVRDNGVIVKLHKTNPTNPIRNIRVVLARDQYNYEKDLVTANFMTFINQFSTIRFMDLLHTNGNPVKEWNETTRPDQDTQAKPSGISIQLLTKIVQRTGRNAWINVPHQASNSYVQTLAQYLKANISSNKIIYVEYSNQVWNTFFEQGKYATEQATKFGLANYHKFYAKRSLQIFNIFSSVFGSGSPRLKFVISYQAVSKWVADQILNGTGLVGVAHIVAGGPYYDCDSIGNTTNTALFATLSPADVINKCNSSFQTMDSILAVENTVASAYNLSIAAYESGTSISQTQTIYNGNQNPDATANFIAANRDSGMYEIYKKLLNKYKDSNFTLNAPLMLFSSIGAPSKYGSWGLLDYLDQVSETPTHPKFQAVIDFNLGI